MPSAYLQRKLNSLRTSFRPTLGGRHATGRLLYTTYHSLATAESKSRVLNTSFWVVLGTTWSCSLCQRLGTGLPRFCISSCTDLRVAQTQKAWELNVDGSCTYLADLAQTVACNNKLLISSRSLTWHRVMNTKTCPSCRT